MGGMSSTMGNCPKCMAINSRSIVNCIECHERLPWADEAQQQLDIRAQETKKAQQTAQMQNVAASAKATPAKATPAKVATLDDDDTEWWIVVGAGILLLALAAFSFWRFSVMETTGGFMRMRWYTALLYNMGGKWLAAGLFSLLGIGSIIVGIMQYLEERK
ncbi:MAG TPA: hypothetical protein VF719_11925 [Abditibacteriaceae bacterium]